MNQFKIKKDLNLGKMNQEEVMMYQSILNQKIKLINPLQQFPITNENFINFDMNSGEQSKELIDRAFNYNIVDMINKPFSEDKRRSAIMKTMGNN